MNLYDMNITVGELLKNSEARNVLTREFPSLAGSPIIKLYQNVSLKQIISLARGKIPDNKIRELIEEIEKI